MNPTIVKVTPDPVELDELRPGDCFERCNNSGWVHMLTDMPTNQLGRHYIVNLNSGECYKTIANELVFPLKTDQVKMSYDFERAFEDERRG